MEVVVAHAWTYDARSVGEAGKCTVDFKCGPALWSHVDAVPPEVNMCGGQHQSPIDLRMADAHVVKAHENDKDLWHAFPDFEVHSAPSLAPLPPPPSPSCAPPCA